MASRPKGDGRFQPGNQMSLVHGASVGVLKRPMPQDAPPAPVQALIDWAYEVWEHLMDADIPLVRTWAYVSHRLAQIDRFYDNTTNQSMLDHKGRPRPGAGNYKDLINQKRELEKVLGIGPGPRAQIAQQQASSGRDVTLTFAAQQRLRSRVKVLAPSEVPALPPTPGDEPSEDSSSSPMTPSV